MASIGVNIAVVQANTILLTKREDFEVWCLPGGAVNEDESLVDAAVREAREEIGLDVVISSLVGIYSRPNWHDDGSHVVVFSAQVMGGDLRLQHGEVLEARYFQYEELDSQVILFGHHQRIQDALNGKRGVVWTQFEAWPFSKGISRQELYALRDRSGLSRRDFYLRYFAESQNQPQRLEVDPAGR